MSQHASLLYFLNSLLSGINCNFKSFKNVSVYLICITGSKGINSSGPRPWHMALDIPGRVRQSIISINISRQDDLYK